MSLASVYCYVTGEHTLDGAHDSLFEAQAQYKVVKDNRFRDCTDKAETKEVNSPRVISSYSSTYNGVDRKDRETSDWTISVKSHRWYLRLYYRMVDAAIHSSHLLVVHIANKRAEINPEHPWLKYSGSPEQQ
jgi:hypothetical protein